MRRAYLLSLSLFVVAPAFADTLTGKVVKVADGDTISVLDNTKLRTASGFKASTPRRKASLSAMPQEKHLAGLVAGKSVTVQWAKHDRYGRIVSTVFVDGRDVDLEQIKAGMAWFYRYYQNELTPEHRKRYAHAEEQARAAKVGLWQEKSPVPLWEWWRLYR